MDGQLNNLVSEWFDIDHRDAICVSSLSPEKTAFSRAGEPSASYPVVKVGGTNGKGSTVRFIAWSLIKSGYDVGVMSNPSATTTPTDVIQINRESISRDTLKAYCEDVFALAPADTEPYGIRTIAALQWFADNNVDIAVLEAGVGGRTDAMNLTTGTVTAITTVGEDHMQSLGGSPDTVQSHIAGFADTDKPVVVNADRRRNTTLYEQLRNVSSSVIRSNPHCDLFRDSGSLTYRASLEYNDVIETIDTSFIAPYQQHNIDTALTVLSELDISVPASAVFETIASFSFPGRSEIRECNGTTVVLDGAHNIPAIQSLVSGLRNIPHDVTFVFSALEDKDWQEMCEEVATIGEVIITQPQGTTRTNHEQELRSMPHNYIESPVTAINTATANSAGKNSIVCVTGSLYLMRQIRPELDRND